MIENNVPNDVVLLTVLLCRSLAQLDTWSQIRATAQKLGRALSNTAREIAFSNDARALLQGEFTALRQCLNQLKEVYPWNTGPPFMGFRRDLPLAILCTSKASVLLDAYVRLYKEQTSVNDWDLYAPFVQAGRNAVSVWTNTSTAFFVQHVKLREIGADTSQRASVLMSMEAMAQSLGMDVDEVRSTWEGLLGPGVTLDQLAKILDKPLEFCIAAVQCEQLVWREYLNYRQAKDG